jgi:hypothetical protein
MDNLEPCTRVHLNKDGYRKCVKCEEKKPLAEFIPCPSIVDDGLSYYCQDCTARYNRVRLKGKKHYDDAILPPWLIRTPWENIYFSVSAYGEPPEGMFPRWLLATTLSPSLVMFPVLGA